MGPLLGPPAPPSFEPLVTALINELAAGPGGDEVLLVLDDYHAIGSQPVHASVGFLLEHRPPGLHVALASRADPPLALARLRARGQLTELRAADLRFTAGEAAGLLEQTGAGPGMALPEAAVAALVARTEGWAAGLQLAALSLRGQEDVATFVAAFTGSHRYVLDYLAEEVLERQGEQVRAFLLETSVLDRLSGELCDAVTGRTGSQALLEQVERAGLFLVPLDEVRGWWRYHQLFADLLRARLQAEQPGRVAQLHRNAARWYEQHGLADEADPARGRRRRDDLGRPADRAAFRRGPQPARRSGDDPAVAHAAARRPGPVPSPAAAGAGGPGGHRRPPGGGGAAGRRGGTRQRGHGRGAARAHDRHGRQPAGERPRLNRARPWLSRPAPRRRTGHRRVRRAGHGRDPRR